MYTYTYTYTYTYSSVAVLSKIFICMHVCMYICMYVDTNDIEHLPTELPGIYFPFTNGTIVAMRFISFCMIRL